MKNHISLSLLLILCACSEYGEKPVKIMAEPTVIINYPKKPLVISKEDEEGLGVDIRLSIVNISENNTESVYKVISTHENKELGFLLSVPTAKAGDKGFGKGIIFKSMGSQSDHFLQTLATLYKVKTDSTEKFASTPAVNYVDLKESAKNPGSKDGGSYSPTREYKLFFGGKDDNECAELYLNINTRDHWIELREKDEGYRPMVIRYLGK